MEYIFTLLGLMLIFAIPVGALWIMFTLVRKLNKEAEARQPALEKGQVFALVAALCLMVAVGSAAYTIYFLSGSRATTATLVRIVETKNDEDEIVRTPVYRYEVDGLRYEDRPSGSDGRKFAIGDEIPIRYLQSRPHESRIDYWGYHWALSVIMLIAAIGFAAAATLLRRIKRPRPACHAERSEP